ncbi:hypothetical protein ACTXLQ_00420 [Enterococcus hirae]|uniref:hypothetical protein n=1 Tax=Enterococcus hirae TaxID=1354 RepID=UPI0019F6507D|nr:hypothetical protein [Enterococcus hirae]EMF0233596.1 hypothetical protein [Enterococcus hirae]EMF0238976.1 hypothetical protein [Enterococcus hirae]EMF0241660.1 hypothetical protein [Enterococcus hirae]EMF0390742.1 hypothetical protein [Enterococcus hirae]
MNEKIENLIEELKSECQKQSVSIICTAQKEGELKSIIYGETTEILLCLAMQEEHLDDNFPVPAHIVRRIAVDAYKRAQSEEENQSTNHTFVIDNKEDFADVMTRILKGEFNDE